jgi:hypothetical protein
MECREWEMFEFFVALGVIFAIAGLSFWYFSQNPSTGVSGYVGVEEEDHELGPRHYVPGLDINHDFEPNL